MRSLRVSPKSALYFALHALLILAGIAINEIKGTFWTALGTGLIGTGVAGAVIYVYLARTDAVSERLEALQVSGIHRVYGNRAAQIRGEYDSALNRARQQIDIVGFGLSDFRRDYLDKLGELSGRAHIRILLLDPLSPYADQRDTEEHQSPSTISRQISEFLKQYKATYGQTANFNQASLIVRLHNALPTVNTFRIDNELFWGPYLVGQASGNTLTIRVTRGGILFEQLDLHFERLWSDYTREPDWLSL